MAGKRLAAFALLAGGLLPAAPAAAQTADPWSCRASAARVTVASLNITVEPVRANAASNACTAQSASALEQTTIGPLTADAVGAFTARVEGGGGSALASISHPRVELPGLTVAVDALEATAKAECSGGNPVVSGTSRVLHLTINGQTIAIPDADAPFELDLQALGKINLNQEMTEGGTLTRRAVAITTPLAEVVLGEAVAGFASGACTPGSGGTAGAGGGGTARNPCPPGSVYDSGRNLCIVRESDGTVTKIVVGRPFEGPSGGTVMSLAEARARYKSVCLKGAGPQYAVIGTNGADRITGTNDMDRILLLKGRDHTEGGRGDDCADGGRGVDTMSGALGKDRLYGKTGSDHLIGGSHVDLLSSGRGRDTINSGFGADRVRGGRGRDRINVATAGPAARVRCGPGWDKIRVNSNEIRRLRGCERVYSLR